MRQSDDPGAKAGWRKIAATVWLPVFSATALVLAVIFFVAAATCAWSPTQGQEPSDEAESLTLKGVVHDFE